MLQTQKVLIPKTKTTLLRQLGEVGAIKLPSLETAESWQV